MKHPVNARLMMAPLSLLTLAVGAIAAIAQPTGWLPEIWLQRGFAPNPLTIDGHTTGTLSARRVFDQQTTPTGPCLGYISNTPDHILTLDTFFDNLSVTVESERDTTLIVQGPGGIWCNDDSDSSNPRIAGQWLPGSYQIWVGAYHASKQSPYTLRIRDLRTAQNLEDTM
jgi:hypothetical protein